MSLDISNSPVSGLPAKYFNDPDIFDRIRENIFFRTWQFACHQSQLTKPGDFLSFSLFDQDILVVRDRDGKLRAMFNVCQHRGHRLVEGSGNKRLLVCPYHAWSYDLDGALKAAPNSGSVAGFNAANICIPQIRLEVFLGFVFINLNPECEPMGQCYPGVKEEISALCPDITEQKFAFEHSVDEGCNWLIAVENYNECYHCKVAHPDFAKGVIDPASYGVLPFGEGQVLNHSSMPSQSDEAWYDVSGSDYASYFLWPSTSIQIYPVGMVNSYYWRPLHVADVRVHRGWFSADGNVDEVLQKVIDLDRETTFAEDLVLVKNVQRGIQSKGYRPGPLVVDPSGGIDNELSVSTLHQWVREAVD
ncbi:MAG: aromatic ring-hydroxylating oxygenase subunit alpha [bacterium]